MQVPENIFVLLNVLQFEVDSFQSEHCRLSEVFTATLLEAAETGSSTPLQPECR